MKVGGHHVFPTLNVRFGWLEKNGVWLAATKIAGVGGEKADERQEGVVIDIEEKNRFCTV